MLINWISHTKSEPDLFLYTRNLENERFKPVFEFKVSGVQKNLLLPWICVYYRTFTFFIMIREDNTSSIFIVVLCLLFLKERVIIITLGNIFIPKVPTYKLLFVLFRAPYSQNLIVKRNWGIRWSKFNKMLKIGGYIIMIFWGF